MKALLCAGLALLPLLANLNAAEPVYVTVRLDQPGAVFDPLEALGAGVDGHFEKDTEAVYKPEVLQKMLAAGLHPLSYRLRSELAIEAWHWNPKGMWSDPARQCGYWTSNSSPASGPIRLSYGYRLPRRGDTLDEANNDGWSMLDDGDLATFWKSNPYLDEKFTGDAPGSHPQWVAVAFPKAVPINAIRIHWAAPYATRFEVEWGDLGDEPYFGMTLPGMWKRFDHGTVATGKGGDALLKLADRPVMARHVRIRLLESSHKMDREPGSTDERDRMGYAIREIEVGRLDAKGKFHDAIEHKPSRHQTVIYTSSTDPWHRASDRDLGVTQPGFDLVAESGLMRGLPLMVPLPVFYDTPENAAGIVEYLKGRGIAYHRVELGEEPDGQRAEPTDFAALYLQVAARVREIDPQAVMGGPSFVTVEGDAPSTLTGFHRGLWTKAFVDYLQERGRLGDFRFLSFEWYPFNEGLRSVPWEVGMHSGLLRNAINLIRAAAPAGTPLIISEFGYSAYAHPAELDLGGALMNTEVACQFLAMGGATAFLYGYEPESLQNDWGGEAWGNNTILLADKTGGLTPTATYHAAHLLTHEWAQAEGGPHRLFPAEVTNAPLLAAYPLQRPDGRWAVMFINKDPKRAMEIALEFVKGNAPAPSPFAAPFEAFTFSSREYEWKKEGKASRPVRNHPASRAVITPAARPVITLPPWSLTVIRSGT